MKTITIQISVPDGVEFRVVSGPPPDDFEHEPLPDPEHFGPDADLPNGHHEPQSLRRDTMAPVAVAPVQVAGACPIHGQPWKVVPGGISKKTGKSYDSFRACPVRGCNEKPR